MKGRELYKVDYFWVKKCGNTDSTTDDDAAAEIFDEIGRGAC